MLQRDDAFLNVWSPRRPTKWSVQVGEMRFDALGEEGKCLRASVRACGAGWTLALLPWSDASRCSGYFQNRQIQIHKCCLNVNMSKRALRLCDFPSGHRCLCPAPVWIAADCSLGHGYKDSDSSSMKPLSLLCIFCIIALVLVPGTSAFFFVSDKILVLSLVTAPLKLFFRIVSSSQRVAGRKMKEWRTHVKYVFSGVLTNRFYGCLSSFQRAEFDLIAVKFQKGHMNWEKIKWTLFAKFYKWTFGRFWNFIQKSMLNMPVLLWRPNHLKSFCSYMIVSHFLLSILLFQSTIKRKYLHLLSLEFSQVLHFAFSFLLFSFFFRKENDRNWQFAYLGLLGIKSSSEVKTPQSNHHHNNNKPGNTLVVCYSDHR